MLHFLLVTVVPGCLFAGWWQVHRALSGNLLSYFYSIEWPVFAVLGVVAWWQLIHDQPAGTGGHLAAGAIDEEARADLAARFATEAVDGDGAVVAAQAEGQYRRARKSWFYHQDDYEGPRTTWDRTFESQELADYNRYLTALSAGKARKTWSNPRGLPEEASEGGGDAPGGEAQAGQTGPGQGNERGAVRGHVRGAASR